MSVNRSRANVTKRTFVLKPTAMQFGCVWWTVVLVGSSGSVLLWSIQTIQGKRQHPAACARKRCTRETEQQARECMCARVV